MMVDEEEEEEEDEGKELEEKGNTFADSSTGRRDKRKERNNTVVIKEIRGGRKPEDLASALLPHSPIKPRAILRAAPDRKKNNVAKNRKTSFNWIYASPSNYAIFRVLSRKKLDR